MDLGSSQVLPLSLSHLFYVTMMLHFCTLFSSELPSAPFGCVDVFLILAMMKMSFVLLWFSSDRDPPPR